MRDLRPEQADREVSWVVALLPTVQGDSFTLRTLFFNLLINALKFTRPREHARSEVLAEQRPGQFLIGVRDNGVGFDMRPSGRLFGFSQRLHSERDFEGNGMGLTLAHRCPPPRRAAVGREPARRGGHLLGRPAGVAWLAPERQFHRLTAAL
ncbi:MAG: ATP-binding protein [Deinococcus sp.]